MNSQVRFRGRFVVELPILNICNRQSIIANGKMHTVSPPQLDEAVIKGGVLVSLVPVNNKELTHRDPIEGGNVELGAGKDPQKHETNPNGVGRQSVSRILTLANNLRQEDTPVDYAPIRGLWKKAFKK
jgi:hypothetical protein